MGENIRRHRRRRRADLNVHPDGAQKRTGRRRDVVTITVTAFFPTTEGVTEKARSVTKYKFGALWIKHISPPSFGDRFI